MAECPSFLLVCDSTDEYSVRMLWEMLSELGVVQVAAETELVRRLEEQSYDAVVVDAGAVVRASTAVNRILEQSPTTQVFVVTASPHWRVARDVLRAGAADYLPKSRLREDLLESLRKIAEQSARPRQVTGDDDKGS